MKELLNILIVSIFIIGFISIIGIGIGTKNMKKAPRIKIIVTSILSLLILEIMLAIPAHIIMRGEHKDYIEQAINDRDGYVLDIDTYFFSGRDQAPFKVGSGNIIYKVKYRDSGEAIKVAWYRGIVNNTDIHGKPGENTYKEKWVFNDTVKEGE